MRLFASGLKILRAKFLTGSALKLEFSDGTQQVVDFGPFLRTSTHPEIRKYLKPALFKKFKLADGELMWGDFDLIFPVIDLYQNSLFSRKTNARKLAI